MLILPNIILLISCLTLTLASPNPGHPPARVEKRLYIHELKATMGRIHDSWKAIERTVGALPATATVREFEDTKSAIDKLSEYIDGEYSGAIQKNGPFTHEKWSTEFLDDLKRSQPHAVNAIHLLQTHIPRIGEAGGHPLLKEFETSTSNLRSQVGGMEDLLGRHILQFVGGTELLDSVIDEFSLYREIGTARRAFYNAWCALQEWCS